MVIGVWGDSITYGAGDSEALGWVGRIRKSFDVDEDVCVYNFGICGETTEGLLERFAMEAKALQPEIILLAIGINDSKFPAGQENSLIPFEEYKENINKLVELAKNFTNKVYLVGLTKSDDGIVRSSGSRFKNEIIQKYNDYLKGLGKSEGVGFIDVFDLLDVETDLIDGVHPNDQGYEKMYKAIVPNVIL